MTVQVEDAMLTLGALLRRTSTRVPDRIALICDEQKVSYAELDRLTNRAANGLVAAGIKPGDPIGLLVNKRIELVVMFLACARMGAVATPINFKLTHDRIRFQFIHIGMKAVLIEKEHAPILEAVRDLLPDPAHIVTLPELSVPGATSWSALIDTSDADPHHEAQASDLVYLNYTSGSTGRPKGARTTHANILWNCVSNLSTFEMTEHDVFLGMFSTFSHPHELFHRSLYLGGTAVLCDSLSPRIVAKAVQQNRVTWMMAVPSFYEMLFHQAGSHHVDLSSLRVLEAGGAFVDAQTLVEFETRFGCSMMPVWGCTEATGVGIALVPGPDRKPGTIGRACAFYEVQVVDEAGKEVGPNTVGELRLRGPAVVTEYLNEPEETSRLFRDGWYHTQDLVTQDEDGFFRFVARRSEMLKIGGIRVYPSEIELAIRQHSEVQNVAVVGASDRLRGEQARAIVVRKEGTSLSEKDLRHHCRKTLAVYQVPRIIEFWEALPQLPNGKVDKKAIMAAPLPHGHE